METGAIACGAAIDVQRQGAAGKLRDAAVDGQLARRIARRQDAVNVHIAVDLAGSAGNAAIIDPDLSVELVVEAQRSLEHAGTDVVGCRRLQRQAAAAPLVQAGIAVCAARQDDIAGPGIEHGIVTCDVQTLADGHVLTRQETAVGSDGQVAIAGAQRFVGRGDQRAATNDRCRLAVGAIQQQHAAARLVQRTRPADRT